MSKDPTPLQLPNYQEFVDAIAMLALPISASELHGVMCGYLAALEPQAGEAYVRALMPHKSEKTSRATALVLFNTYTASQQQMTHLGFEFQLLLPDDERPLVVRAQAFSEWCEGFSQGLTLSCFDYHALHDEDVQEAITHITEFGQLDYQSLQVDEEDERALMEVTEYTRMAVLHIYAGISLHKGQKGHEMAH